METPTPPAPPEGLMPAPADAPKSRAGTYLGIAAGIVLIAALIWWLSSPAVAPSPIPTPSGSPEAQAEFDAELNALQDVDLDAEMQQIDADLEQL